MFILIVCVDWKTTFNWTVYPMKLPPWPLSIVHWAGQRGLCVGWSTRGPGPRRCWSLCAWSCRSTSTKPEPGKNAGNDRQRPWEVSYSPCTKWGIMRKLMGHLADGSVSKVLSVARHNWPLWSASNGRKTSQTYLLSIHMKDIVWKTKHWGADAKDYPKSTTGRQK